MVYFGHSTEHFAHVVQLEGMQAGNYNDFQLTYVQMGSDMIEDTQVKTGGVDASTPMGTGLAISSWLATLAAQDALGQAVAGLGVWKPVLAVLPFLLTAVFFSLGGHCQGSVPLYSVLPHPGRAVRGAGASSFLQGFPFTRRVSSRILRRESRTT